MLRTPTALHIVQSEFFQPHSPLRPEQSRSLGPDGSVLCTSSKELRTRLVKSDGSFWKIAEALVCERDGVYTVCLRELPPC